jgi:glycine/D-amino acid oxidase-like deaminating enzyme
MTSAALSDAEASPQTAKVNRVVICGGGVIGTAVCYYLAKQGVMSTVVDRCGLAAAASGRAGMQEFILTQSFSALPARPS